MRARSFLTGLAMLATWGCSDSGTSGDGGSAGTGQGGTAGSGGSGGIVDDRDWVELETDEFTLAGGEEQYLCWAKTLEEDFVIDGFRYGGGEGVHHLLLAKTILPEPEGMNECGKLFRPTWVPLFGAGSSEARLEVPEGAGHTLPAGTQVLVQLHLLNTTGNTITNAAAVDMRRAEVANPTPIGIYAFGSSSIMLPPQQTSTVVDECEIPKDVEVFAVLPHMHFLGNRLTFEVGKGGGDYVQEFEIDPWDFDQQVIEPHPLTLAPGDKTRTTCFYDNRTDNMVQFGESSFDEMCFFVTFQLGTDALDGCLTFDASLGF